VAAIQASPNGSLNTTSDISQLCLKYPELHEALRASGRLRGFCEAHPELTIDGHFVKMTKARPLTALEIMVAAIHASPKASLSGGGEISQLCLEHSGLHEALRAAGGLKGFCKAHPELTRIGSRVALSNCQSQQPATLREEEELHKDTKLTQDATGPSELQKEATGRQRAAIQKQAKETRRQMLEQKEMALKEEKTRQLKLQKEGTARQRAPAREQAAETSREMPAKWKEAQKLHTTSFEQDQESILQKIKWEEASRQRMHLLAFLLAGP